MDPKKSGGGFTPEDVLWRPKVKFWEVGGKIRSRPSAETQISDADFRNERRLPDGSYLNTKEELFYYRIFKEHFGPLRIWIL